MKIKNKQTNFNQGIYKNSLIKTKGLPFASLYFNKNIGLKYALAALTGFLFAVLMLFLLKNTGGYSYGLSSLMQGVARAISFAVFKTGLDLNVCQEIYSGLFWGLLFAVNIPLLFFAYFKIGKRFALLSLTFLAVNTATGLLLDLIPHIHDIFIFGDTRLVVNQQYDSIWIKELNNLGIQILPFMVPNEVLDTYHPANFVKPLFLILSVVVYAISAGIVFSVLYIVGGCTAGTDIIACYLSSKKGMNVARPFFFINLTCILIGASLGTYMPAALTDPICTNYQFFFSANLIGTIISLAVFTLIFKHFYPRNNKFTVNISSKKAKDIKKHLTNNQYMHNLNSYVINDSSNNKKINKLETVVSGMELSLLLDQVTTIDPQSTIIVCNIKYFGGPLKTHQLGSSSWKK